MISWFSKSSKESILGKDVVDSNNKLLITSSIVAITVIALLFFDSHIIVLTSKHVPEGIKDFSLIMRDFGLYPFYILFACILTYALLKSNRKLLDLSVAYIKAQIIFSLILVRLMKMLFGRARPQYGGEFTFLSFDYLGVNGLDSFPSGHAADAFTNGLFLFFLLKHSEHAKYRFLPLIYASLIALSRLTAGHHYPSDIVAGTAIGIGGASFFLSRLSRKSE
jgi:undecaprenyl-diphosphatase